MNNKDADNPVPKQAHRGPKQPKGQPGASMKKNQTTSNTPSKNACVSSGSIMTVRRIVGKGKEMKPEKVKRIGKGSLSVTECQKNQNTSRKLSDASNVSEDLSRDSGCVFGKISSSDSSSEISDCTEGCLTASEENQLSADNPSSSESGSSGRDGETKSERSSGNAVNSVSEISRTHGGNQFIQISHAYSNMHSCSDGQPSSECGGSNLALYTSLNANGTLMGYELANETREDLVKENEELRSENEYLKDEMEEMRCEMLEMRDLFLEDEMYQLQDLRLQLEQANKTCRILQYRLRKAERRSLRVAQTGQVDGELVRSLEHDVKIAKNVSLRLHNEVESLQQKNIRLELENQRLRESQQEMEVTKQVLQTEMEKARASSLKRTNTRSPASKAEKKLPRQDDSDLKCQLHFAKEELALMCKKLTKIMSESERMREELAKYRLAYGDVDADCSAAKSPHTREAEVKVHLRLVEEEATLLSRRIVELEVENRGLRAVMSDMRSGTQDGGTAAGEEDEELLQERPLAPGDRAAAHAGSAEGGERGGTQDYIQSEEWVSEGQRRSMVDDSQSSQSQTERPCPLNREPGEERLVGEQELSHNHNNQQSDARRSSLAHGLNVKEPKSLLALRDHACLVASAIQLLASPAKNSQSCPPSSTHPGRVKSYPQDKTQPLSLDPLIHLYDALDLLRAMLLALIGRVESLVTPGGEVRVQGDGDAMADQNNTEASARQDIGEGLPTAVMKDRVIRPSLSDPLNSCRDPMMQLTLKVLWGLHHHCLRNINQDEKQSSDTMTMSMLHGLWQYLGKVLQDSEASMAAQDGITSWTSDLNGLICRMDGTPARTGVQRVSPKETRNVAPRAMKTGNKGIPDHLRSKMKNWCYLSQEAAQLNQDDPFKTWDHPIMPHSFPNLDQLSLDRSHTAPDKTFLRIYYSPPSARRVHLAHPSHSANANATATVSVISAGLSPSQSPHTPLCLRLSANLSDDMKEMTASLQQAVHSSSQERGKGRGAMGCGWAVSVASSGTQTQLHPQMVSVGLQTDAPTSGCAVRSSPLRLSARAQQISISLDRLPGRTKSGSTSPKLYRRHSASVSPPSSISPSSSSFSSSFITPTSNTSSSSTASSATANREQVLWGLSNRVPAGSNWAHPANLRAGPGLPHHGPMDNELSNGGNTTKLNSKPSGTNRYGLVTEFLRKMSGRADKSAPGSASGGGQKGKINPSNPPAAAAAYRNDSVTRIVNHRFMKQREETALSHKEGTYSSQNKNQAVRRDLSLESNVTLEDGHYDCSSSRSLTSCFARSSRSSTQRNSLTPTKLQRHRYASAVNGAGSEHNSSCE